MTGPNSGYDRHCVTEHVCDTRLTACLTIGLNAYGSLLIAGVKGTGMSQPLLPPPLPTPQICATILPCPLFSSASTSCFSNSAIATAMPFELVPTVLVCQARPGFLPAHQHHLWLASLNTLHVQSTCCAVCYLSVTRHTCGVFVAGVQAVKWPSRH